MIRMTSDEELIFCNETELIALAAKQGLPRLCRGIPHEELVALVRGDRSVEAHHVASTTETRMRLEKYITENFNRARSQLPGCTGKCTIYPCTDARHGACFGVNEDIVT